MRRTRLVSPAVCALLAGVACGPEAQPRDEGIFVGNPPGVVSAVGASGQRGVATVTQFSLAASTAFDCAGQPTPLALREDDPIGFADLPAGSWCALEMEPDAPVILDGEYDGVSFTLTVTVERIRVEGLLELLEDDPERAFVLELGEESAFADRLAFSDPDRRVELDTETCRGEALCEEIIAAIEDGSALFEDLDLNDRIDERERTDHERMRGADRGG